MNLNSGLKISIVLSIILHILAVSVLIFLPKGEVEKKPPLVARLVIPEEIPGLGQDRNLITPQRERSKISKGEGKSREDSKLKGTEGLSHKFETEGNGVKGMVEQEARSEEARAGEKRVEKPSSPPSPSSNIPSIPPIQVPSKPSPFSPKERLFDKEVVERLAKREKEEPPDRGISFDTKELRYYSYMQRLKEKIERIWRYPPQAAEKGIYGDLYIRFTINKDGRLGNIELLRTSGYRDLDEAAIRALKDAEPFWPLPDEWKKEDLIITGHFIYSLYGIYLR